MLGECCKLQAFIDGQKALDPEFADSFDEGYKQFKAGELLRQARESAWLTQKEIAGKLRINSQSSISLNNAGNNTPGKFSQLFNSRFFPLNAIATHFSSDLQQPVHERSPVHPCVQQQMPNLQDPQVIHKNRLTEESPIS